MYCLYTQVMFSLNFPKDEFVSAHRTLKRVLVLAFILSVCCLKVIPVSWVIASVVGVLV